MVLPLATLIAVAALGTGIYAIATQPQTTSLQRNVAALNVALTRAHAQILALQSVVLHAASRSNVSQLQSTVGSLQHAASLLRGNVGQIRGDINGLQSSVGQLQGNVSQLQGQMRRVLTCLPQLEQQVDSLNAKTTTMGGFLTSASLANPTPVSKQCAQTVFGF
jgi:ABC-type transporter Mla subunit MlaD